MRKILTLMLICLLSSVLSAQTWQQVTPTGSWQQSTWASGRGWNQLLSDGGTKLLAWEGLTPCGDPFTHLMGQWDTSITPLPYSILWWDGSGASNGTCTQPIDAANTQTVMGTRHTMHQTAVNCPVAGQEPCVVHQMGGVVELNGVNMDYPDNWELDILTGVNTRYSDNPTGLGKRIEGCMAHDPIHNVDVLYGGTTNGGTDAKTWEYSYATHTFSLTNSAGPQQRIRCTMAWDAFQQKVLMFGGLSGSTWLNDLEAYDAGTHTWTNLNPRGTPPPATIHFLPLAYAADLNGAFSYVQTGQTYFYSSILNSWVVTSNQGGPAACSPTLCNARSLVYVNGSLWMIDVTTNDNNQIMWTLAAPSTSKVR